MDFEKNSSNRDLMSYDKGYKDMAQENLSLFKRGDEQNSEIQEAANSVRDESDEEANNDLALVIRDKRERKEQLKENMAKLDVFNRRKWMVKHDCFNSLDADGGGTIGLEELENPLIGLGFADSRDDVKKLIEIVDKDGNGDIDFNEFCYIIKNSGGDEKSQQIYEFF